MKNIFEYLKEKFSCEYVFDLCYGEKAVLVKKTLSEIDLSEFKLSDLEDVAELFYNQTVSFRSIERAKEFFNKNK